MARYALLFGLVKGLLLSLVMAAVDISFWKQVIVAAVSATIGAGGVIAAAIVTRAEVKRNRQEIEHVKHAMQKESTDGQHPVDTSP